MTTAAIYCRISSDKTGEQAGVTRQLEDCRNLAATLNWPIVEEYIDNDISATSGKTRPRFEALLGAVKSGEVDAIICWHPDRLYRKLRDLERLIDAVERNHVAVRPVMSGEVDLSSASGRGVARILGVIATMEGEQKSERWRRSVRQRRENGQAPGWGPRLFGYTKDSEVIDAEADAIRWATSQVLDGADLGAVARALTTQGHMSTRGNPWTIVALRKLLTNPRIAGHSTLNGQRVGTGDWAAILDDETFTQLQTTLTMRRKTRARSPRVAVLAGLITCGNCGHTMRSGRSSGTRAIKGQRIYRCQSQAGSGACGRISTHAEPLEQMVEAYAQARLADPRVREQMTHLAATAGENTHEIISLEDRITELEQQLSEPGVPVEALTLAIGRTRDRIEQLAATSIAPTTLPDTWPTDLARRARLIQLVVAEIVVGPAPIRGLKTFQPERVQITPR